MERNTKRMEIAAIGNTRLVYEAWLTRLGEPQSRAVVVYLCRDGCEVTDFQPTFEQVLPFVHVAAKGWSEEHVRRAETNIRRYITDREDEDVAEHRLHIARSILAHRGVMPKEDEEEQSPQDEHT